MASGPKRKPKEIKKKTFVDKLAESALFILFMVILVIVDVVAFIFWISAILSGNPDVQGWPKVVQAPSFLLFAGLGAVIGAFFLMAWLVKRAAPRKT